MSMKRLWLIIPLLLILSGCATGKQKTTLVDPETLYKEAEERIKKGRYEEARETLQRVIERDAENYGALAQIRTADSYYNEAKFDEAIEEYKKFLSLYPHHRHADYVQYQIGMAHFNQIDGIDRGYEHLQGAAAQFERLSKNYPRTTFADESREKLRICNDMTAQYEFYVGHFYFKKDSYQAAIGRFEGLLKRYPGSSSVPDALYYLGLSYQEIGNKDKAKEALHRLIKEYPDYKNKKDAEGILSRL